LRGRPGEPGRARSSRRDRPGARFDFGGPTVSQRGPSVSSARAALLAAFTAGCSVPHEAGFPDVARDVDQRIGHALHWNRGGEDAEAVLRAVRAMLAHPLTPAEAVQIALVNNPTLQATYEELMIAQSDVVQAGLLQNPVFTGGVHVPIGAPVVPHVE